MPSIQGTARRAGILYLMMSILAIIGFFYLPSTWYVAGDATATARNIVEKAFIYRLGLLNSMATEILFLMVVLTLYQLFKDIDRGLARTMVMLVAVPVAAQIANLVHETAPLVLLGGSQYLSALPKSELDAMVMAQIRMGGSLSQMLNVFWGLWLFPFGILMLRSGYFPKFLAILLFVSGAAYLITFVVNVLDLAQVAMIRRIMMPLYFGEFIVVLWMAFVGARPPRSPVAADAGGALRVGG